MGSKANNSYDDELSNGDSGKGNDTSLIVNVNDTQSEIDDEHEDSHYETVNENENNHRKSPTPKKETSKSKKSRNNDSSSKRSSQKESKQSKPKAKVEASKTRYLWVSGIPDGTKTGQLEELFLQYGKVLAIKIIRGGTNSTLLGFVKLETVEQANKCMEKLNKVEFRGNKIELLKERPVDKEGKKPEKIGFRDSRKPFVSRPPPIRPHFRPPPAPVRGPIKGFRTPIKPLAHSSHREHREPAPRITLDIRRQEKEEFLKLEREKERLKLERMKLERDKAELLKIEREARLLESSGGGGGSHRNHHEKRPKGSRPTSKRSTVEETFIEEKISLKHFDEFSRHEEFDRRFESSRGSPERKVKARRSFGSAKIPSSGRFEHNSREGRYGDKYDSKNSWTGSSDNHRWQSSASSFHDSPRIGSSSISRIHSNSDIPQNVSSRSYFSGSNNNNNRRY